MKTIIKSICSIACFLINGMTLSDPILTFYFRPYPILPDDPYCHTVTKSLKELGKISQQCVFGILDKQIPSGIFVTYAGYLNVSDIFGDISFPYKQTKPIINILITPKVEPVMTAGNTVDHWIVSPKTPSSMVTFELKQDGVTKLDYWDNRVSDLPTNGEIPIETIIILAKPHHVYIPMGITPTQPSVNMVLPDIYVKKGLNNTSQALYALNLKHLFGTVRYLNKPDKMRDISLINP
jgi:hypothetical protein